MTKKKPLEKGQARREFYACYDRAKELAERGCNMVLIYEALTEEGAITMSYGAFYDAMTQRRRKRRRGPLVEVEGKPLVQIGVPVQQPLPLYDQLESRAAPIPPAQQFHISLQGEPEKPKGKKPKRNLQGILNTNLEAGAQLETQTDPVDDDPEYAEKKKRVTGKKTAKGK